MLFQNLAIVLKMKVGLIVLKTVLLYNNGLMCTILRYLDGNLGQAGIPGTKMSAIAHPSTSTVTDRVETGKWRGTVLSMTWILAPFTFHYFTRIT